MLVPSYAELRPPVEDLPALEKVKELAHVAAYNLLVELNKRAEESNWKNNLQICTSESLTAGMILATLVDIPWGGYLKYGGFGVYDTDAKRVFNKVSVDDVYTHRCAKEMAVGILKNSNATLAISVTGNAMPLNEHVDMLGEVFIGVAGYQTDKDGTTKIIYQTTSINACDNHIVEIQKTCKDWYDRIKIEKKWNPREKTAVLSQEIRYYTTCKALEFCLQFVQANHPVVPQFVLDRKTKNNRINNTKSHSTIPENKFTEDLPVENVGEPHNVVSPARSNTALYSNLIESKLSPIPGAGGRRTRRIRKTRKH